MAIHNSSDSNSISNFLEMVQILECYGIVEFKEMLHQVCVPLFTGNCKFKFSSGCMTSSYFYSSFTFISNENCNSESFPKLRYISDFSGCPSLSMTNAPASIPAQSFGNLYCVQGPAPVQQMLGPPGNHYYIDVNLYSKE